MLRGDAHERRRRRLRSASNLIRSSTTTYWGCPPRPARPLGPSATSSMKPTSTACSTSRGRRFKSCQPDRV